MGEISEGNTKLGHLERTVDEPRDLSLHHVTIKRIDEVNPTVRLFRLEIREPEGIKSLPGQWLDVYVPDPSIPQAGGFTITCSPSKAAPSPASGNNSPPKKGEQHTGYPYLELAIQQSPLNPVASYLWQSPLSKILNTTLKVRVGGSFVFPPFPFSLNHHHPKEKPLKTLEKVIFIAGGVGVNPLMSMLSYIGETFPFPSPSGSAFQNTAQKETDTGAEEEKNNNNKKKKNLQVHFLYSVKDPNPNPNPTSDQPPGDTKASQSQHQILFLNRISKLFADGTVSGKFKLFLTQSARPTGASQFPDNEYPSSSGGSNYPVYKRRISKQDIVSALGPDKDTSTVYICGVPAMTDYFVKLLTLSEDSGGFGVDTDRVLFEKWW